METLKNKNILVTGGAGFIGSNLVKTLVESHGANVTVLDDLFNGSREQLQGIKHKFVLGSVENKELVNKTVKGQDIVFHLAARNINISNINPREDMSVNVGGCFNIFEACLLHNVSRVVYTSTSSVYGNPQSIPVKEDDAKSFLNFYSASKFTAEIYAKTFHAVFGLPVSVVRYSNVYGPHQTPSNPYCGVIGKFITAAVEGRPLKVHGHGRQTRDYTFVEDAIAASIMAAILPEAIGNEFNIGTGRETSVNELAETILSLTGSKSTLETVSNRDIDNIDRRCIDIEKAGALLHYLPAHTLYQGLQKTIHWACAAAGKPLPKAPAAVAFL